MATSGSTSVTVTSWDTLKFTWTLSSQSVANNTSTVSWTLQLIAGSSGRISSTASKDWSVTVNGTTYSGTNTIGISNNSTKTLATGSTVISHTSDGTKTFNYSFSQEIAITFSGSYIGTKTGSGSGTLTAIPRKSTLTVSNGTLGTAQTLKITENDSGFNHKLYYTCGSSGTVYILGSSSATSSSLSVSWTPPISLASQNTSGTSVTVKFTLATYNGSTLVGSNSYSKTFTIPSSVAPACEVAVSDTTSYYSTYGSYVQGLSKLKVTVTPELAYDSAIATYRTTANGSVYTTASFTTDVLKSSGTLTISATVTDNRGRAGSDSTSITVLAYSTPSVSKMSVGRCNSDGTDNEQGGYAKVVFNAVVTSLNANNAPIYYIAYKKSSSSVYTTAEMEDYTGAFSVTDGTFIFEADTAESYDIRIIINDGIDEWVVKTTSVSTGYVIMHWNTAGDGMGIGKMSELPDVLDIGMQTRLYGGLLYPVLEAETDLNEVLTPNSYIGGNVSKYNYGNCPLETGTFTLDVISMGEQGQVMQRLTQCCKNSYIVFERVYYGSSWETQWHGGWIYPTLTSTFQTYGTSTDNQVRYRKDGRIVELRGSITPTSDITITDTTTYPIFTLPTGYIPSAPIYILCQGSGTCTWLLGIKTSGEVNFARYRNGSSYGTAYAPTSESAGTWLPFQATFIVD